MARLFAASFFVIAGVRCLHKENGNVRTLSEVCVLFLKDSTELALLFECGWRDLTSARRLLRDEVDGFLGAAYLRKYGQWEQWDEQRKIDRAPVAIP